MQRRNLVIKGFAAFVEPAHFAGHGRLQKSFINTLNTRGQCAVEQPLGKIEQTPGVTIGVRQYLLDDFGVEDHRRRDTLASSL